MRKLITIAAGLTIGAAAFAGGYAAHPAGPTPCYVFNGPAGPETGTATESNGTVASGDAIRGAGGFEFVCTDGTWVSVTHYGN